MVDRPPSRGQLAYRQELIDGALAFGWPGAATTPEQMARSATLIALVLSLPEPRTAAEAGDQVNGLKGGILHHARQHPEWAQPVLDRLTAAIGDGGERIPARSPAGPDWAPELWIWYVRQIVER